MTKKIVLITGTSKGLGKVLALKLMKENLIVISGVRDINKAPKGTFPVYIDLTVEKSLEDAVQQIIQKFGKIDILIHNAGIAYVGPVDSMTLEESKQLFAVNFFGPFRLTQLILPYMRKQNSGRIIFVSSVRAVDSGAYIGMYAASKAAIEAIAFDWAATLSKWNISVSVFQPGPINTGIKFHEGSYFQKNNPYPPLGSVSLDWQPVEEVCNVLVEQINKHSPNYKFQSNVTTKNIVQSHLKDPTGNKWLNDQKQWVEDVLVTD
ncbi:MAG: SDR family NAD(P)-dependent oxidoreductase [Simkaniaceae bacterium]